MLHLIYKQFYDTEHIHPFENAMQYVHKCNHHEVPFKPVILLVRDPVERFVSAMTHVGLSDVDECLDSLTNGKRVMLFGKMRRVCEDYHFCKQSSLIFGETHLFKSPCDLRSAADLLGITLDIVHLNKAKRLKPVLNDDQIDRIKEYYKDDVLFYGSISKAGEIVYS